MKKKFNFGDNEYLIQHQEEVIKRTQDIENYLTSLGKSMKKILGFDAKTIQKLVQAKNFSRIEYFFKKIDKVLNLKAEAIYDVEQPFDVDKLVYDQTIEKIQILNEFLSKEKELDLYRAISIRQNTMKRILKAEKQPSMSILKRISDYFMLPVEQLQNNQELPAYENLKVDEDLLKVQKNDDASIFFKNRHYIRKNYRLLGYHRRIKLILSMVLIFIPLLAYTGYCASLVLHERINTVEKYKKGSDETELYDQHDPTQVAHHEKLLATSKKNDPTAFYCDVKVGSKLYLISSISSSTNSYVTRMELYFKFDKEEFKVMFKKYASTVLANIIIDAYELENPTDLKPAQQSMADWIEAHEEYVDQWVEIHKKEYYPGETPSNVLTDKQTMFDIGNGSFVADSYGTVKELEEKDYVDENGVIRTLCYQKVKFEAKFEKAFDSYRYPLDSIQLKMYIQPTMDATYLRYTPDRDTNDYGESLSGFSSYFKLTNGYRAVNETDEIKNFTQKVNYYQDVNNDPSTPFSHTYKTQLEIIVRANRQGISLFLQAFVNLFSVIIWIGIAFYNQSYNGEDSIGMLGTGLFGAISSILVGISMVSDAGLFSLITMINIFTLGVIMIMTYQSIAARRAAVKNDQTAIAYNGIKLRITFFILLICIFIMFIGLPAISYLFGL